MRLPYHLVQFYRPGDDIPKSGIYRVTHQDHHHDHEVTCLSGEQFPECRRCGGRVRFSLVFAAHAIQNHVHFFASAGGAGAGPSITP